MWRRGVAVCAFLGLAGCLGEGTGPGPGARSQDGGGLAFPLFGPKPARQARLAGGKVVVAGPPGYCVDRGTLDARPSGGFALIGACAALGGSGPGVEPIVMTVQVQRRLIRQEAPDAQALTAAVAPARVLAQEDGDGISLIQLAEGGDTVLPGSDPQHWRGAMVINGFLVGLSLYAPEGSGAAGAEGRARLVALAEVLREASPVRDFSAEAAEAAAAREAAQAEGAEPPKRKGLRGMFPNLFQ